jgi:hypothetical protein
MTCHWWDPTNMRKKCPGLITWQRLGWRNFVMAWNGVEILSSFNVKITSYTHTPQIIKRQLLQMWIFANHSTYFTKCYKAVWNESWLRLARSQTRYWKAIQQFDMCLFQVLRFCRTDDGASLFSGGTLPNLAWSQVVWVPAATVYANTTYFVHCQITLSCSCSCLWSFSVPPCKYT